MYEEEHAVIERAVERVEDLRELRTKIEVSWWMKGPKGKRLWRLWKKYVSLLQVRIVWD